MHKWKKWRMKGKRVREREGERCACWCCMCVWGMDRIRESEGDWGIGEKNLTYNKEIKLCIWKKEELIERHM